MKKILFYINNKTRAEKIFDRYSKIDIKKIDKVLETLQVKLIKLGDVEYPESLMHIPHSPSLLYLRWENIWKNNFAVVWSRKISQYWKKAISMIVPEVSKVFSIVSGGALGCDSFAHKTCLDFGKKTVVVVGTWIDKTYPHLNKELFENIVNSGWSVVSIFPLWEAANPYNFPIRNEIVVWLSKWVLVIEAQKKSWSLITAGLCLDLGKDLFTVPWDIWVSNNEGTNELIKSSSAKCVTSYIDILEEYDILIKTVKQEKILPNLSKNEQSIYHLLSENSLNTDDIVSNANLSLWEVGVALSLLEIKWLVKKDISGKYWIF